jgi:hypothetical protein
VILDIRPQQFTAAVLRDCLRTMTWDTEHFAVFKMMVAAEDVMLVAARNNVVDFHNNVSVVTFRTFVEWFAGVLIGAASRFTFRFQPGTFP